MPENNPVVAPAPAPAPRAMASKPAYNHQSYTHFQFIAYEVPTEDVDAPGAEVNVAVGNALAPQDMADARTRLKRLLGVVRKAHTRVETAGTNDRTLKIFMAPEFYFRPNSGPSNSYSQQVMLELMVQLRAVLSHADFKHWLFVPGSIFWSMKQKWNGVERDTFFNTALLLKGGVPADSVRNPPFTFIHKRLVSNADGAPQFQAAMLHADLAKILGGWDDIKANVFECDYLTFGLEVCLDHYFGVLKNQVLPGYRNHTGRDKRVNLHLLTACGMPYSGANAVSVPQGYLLRVDGKPAYRNIPAYRSSSIVRHDVSRQGIHRWTNYPRGGGADMQVAQFTENLADSYVVPDGTNGMGPTQRIVGYPVQPL
jgi:hypothetical protein